jgi:hypothetical protein
VFAVDVLSCHRCGGRAALIAQITQPTVVAAILSALGLPTEAPVVHPARRPAELPSLIDSGARIESSSARAIRDGLRKRCRCRGGGGDSKRLP